jgi:hypothetical protein
MKKIPYKELRRLSEQPLFKERYQMLRKQVEQDHERFANTNNSEFTVLYKGLDIKPEESIGKPLAFLGRQFAVSIKAEKQAEGILITYKVENNEVYKDYCSFFNSIKEQGFSVTIKDDEIIHDKMP